jgi:nucleotide-binding universal stress UspA family protein
LSGIAKFTRILAALDGSDHSVNAANLAISFATKYNSELILLYVIPVDLGMFSYSPPSVEEMKKEAQVFLDKLKQEALEVDKNIQLRTEMISSASVVGGIVNFSDNEKVDLIIVGTRGRSGLKKMLLGSVASGIVNYSQVPVIISR